MRKIGSYLINGLIGTTILHEKDWVKLFKLLKFNGDYYFTTAEAKFVLTIK